MKLTKTNRLKAKLMQLGVTQQELAEAIGYSRPYVSEVLNGYRSDACLTAIEEKVKEWEEEDARNYTSQRK